MKINPVSIFEEAPTVTMQNNPK